MLKVLQARLQKYLNRELPDVQAGFREGRGTRDQMPTSAGAWKKQEISPSSILALRVPWTEEPGGLQSIESQRVGHD